MAPDVSVIIVSYNAPEVLATCLRSVVTQTRGCSIEIIVVDNASDADNVARIEREFPSVVLVKNAANHGFARACNQGLAVSTGSFLLLLNPDTELRDDAISTTVSFLRGKPEAGVAVCRLVNSDGSFQRSVGVFPNLPQSLLSAFSLTSLLPNDLLVGPTTCARFDGTVSAPIDWASGAFMLFRREALDIIGGLDEQFFMYSEDTDFCYRAHRAGLGVWYVAETTVVHHWGGMNSISRRGMLWLHASQLLFLKKYYPWSCRWPLTVLKYVALLVRAPMYLLTGAVTGNPRLLEKSWYVVYVAARLLVTPWRYERGMTGPSRAWTEVWRSE